MNTEGGNSDVIVLEYQPIAFHCRSSQAHWEIEQLSSQGGSWTQRGQIKQSKWEGLGKCDSQETWIPHGMHDRGFWS